MGCTVFECDLKVLKDYDVLNHLAKDVITEKLHEQMSYALYTFIVSGSPGL